MAGMIVPQNTKRATISARVVRADGTTVDYGVVSFYDRNPLQRVLFSVRQRLFGPVDDKE